MISRRYFSPLFNPPDPSSDSWFLLPFYSVFSPTPDRKLTSAISNNGAVLDYVTTLVDIPEIPDPRRFCRRRLDRDRVLCCIIAANLYVIVEAVLVVAAAIAVVFVTSVAEPSLPADCRIWKAILQFGLFLEMTFFNSVAATIVLDGFH